MASPPALPRREGADSTMGGMLINVYKNVLIVSLSHSGSLPTGEGGGRGRNSF